MPPLIVCQFCGRENDPAAQFCIDCGKAMAASGARVVPPSGPMPPSPSSPPPSTPPKPYGAAVQPLPPTRVGQAVGGEGACPRCGKAVTAGLPFCGHCGAKVSTARATNECGSCGAGYTEGVDMFCASCGQRVGKRVSTEVKSAGTLALNAKNRQAGPRIALLDENGDVKAMYTLDRGEAVLGRVDADITFEDVYLSPLHARLELRDGELWIRDLGSRNGTWTFIEKPSKLTDGDIILVGSQLLRFRRLGYPGPHPPEADSTRRMGSLTPSADVAVLEQLRADSSVRDSFHLSPARTVLLGRESGDWVFPYDQTMSSRHAEIRSQDAEFFVHDAGSRNGVAVAVRGERPVQVGQRILIGDQVLRIESITL